MSSISKPTNEPSLSLLIRTVTLPAVVNLIELPIKLTKICRSRIESEMILAGKFSSIINFSFKPFSSALICNMAAISSRNGRSANSRSSISSLSISIFERSKMSSMSPSSVRALRRTVRRCSSRCF